MTCPVVNRNTAAATAYRQSRTAHWDAIGRRFENWTGWGGAYHRRLAEIYRFVVSPGQRVLEIGCAEGDLLAALKASRGVGVDFSIEAIRRARQRHPGLHFVLADAHELPLDETFDCIILSDLVNDLWDVQTVFEQIGPLMTSQTRIILNWYSRIWEMPLTLAGHLGLRKPTLAQNWLSAEGIADLLRLADCEVIRHWEEILWPLPAPLIEALCNRVLVKLWPLNQLALTNFVVARPMTKSRVTSHGSAALSLTLSQRERELRIQHSRLGTFDSGLSTRAPTVSIIVPARNEAGNIPAIFARTPEMGGGTELIFVEGHSQDNTYEAIERAIAERPERCAKLLRQTGVGKGDAVRLGFAHAAGDMLMVLDADLTVPPEDLPRFYEALVSGKGDFVNGVRLVYPMDEEAMRFLNLVGNKLFSLAFSWLLGQPIKDTLCGTKALWRADYERIARNRSYFGDFDPFGDFDLIFGASRFNLKIVDLPIRYQERSYGTTNIHRWRHGLLLLQMLINASRRLKFV